MNTPETTDDSRLQLLNLIRQKSYREGSFVLSSGKTSSFYIDLKPTTLHPSGIQWIAKLMVERWIQMDSITKQGIQGVGGLTLGADPIAVAVSIEAEKRGFFWPAFIVRKEPKKHGTSRYIEGIENIKTPGRVVILEDVVTTGASSVKAAERAREAGLDPILVCGVVDREEGGTEQLNALGISLCTLFLIRDLKSF